MTPETESLIERMEQGNRVALAKLMTLVENREPETAEVMSRLHGRGDAAIVGVTGPPGAGKSTLVDRVVAAMRAAGRKVGVVAVDPSSPFSGGAVLGDRIRMQDHFLDEGVFIRSLSARGSVGGLARATRDMARLLKAFGKDIVIVETVGVGQSELDIMRLGDTVVVVLVPEAGDTVQAMKAGLLEIADIFVVNKADRDGASRIKIELEQMLQLRPQEGWTTPVLMTVALDDKGTTELVAALEGHRQFLTDSGEGEARNIAGREDEFLTNLRDEIGRRLIRGMREANVSAVVDNVKTGKIDPYGAALRVVNDAELLSRVLEAGRS
jgi:LAO/AO transport system kinase